MRLAIAAREAIASELVAAAAEKIKAAERSAEEAAKAERLAASEREGKAQRARAEAAEAARPRADLKRDRARAEKAEAGKTESKRRVAEWCWKRIAVVASRKEKERMDCNCELAELRMQKEAEEMLRGRPLLAAAYEQVRSDVL
eukprot:tig00000269_g23687.t1